MIIAVDQQIKEKVEKKGFTSDSVEKFAKGRNIVIRRLKDLHSRFLLIDGEYCLLLSADFQKDQHTNKYQYGYLTNDQKIFGKCLRYFESMWKDASIYDLIAELKGFSSPTLS